MLLYPSIPNYKYVTSGLPCLVYEKFDGSNLRWEWSRKRGWYKQGTRTRMFDHTDTIFGPSIELFNDIIGKELELVIKSNYNVDRFVAFTEYFGYQSFAGTHVADDPMYLKVFDISINDKTLLDPREFTKLFDEYEWATQCIYRGPMDEKFIDSVEKDQYHYGEGVICKGKNWMAKIKTLKYLEKLKQTMSNWQEIWES